jgi:hypothetical protein
MVSVFRRRLRLMADFVAKPDEEQFARNIQIEARKFFNQHCALVLGLESILRTGPIKIVQQNRPTAANIDLCSNVCCRGVKRT